MADGRRFCGGRFGCASSTTLGPPASSCARVICSPGGRCAGSLHLKPKSSSTHPTKIEAEPIEWNYSKYIVGRDGQVLGRYNQQVAVAALEEQITSLL